MSYDTVALSALRASGRPMTTQEIMDVIGADNSSNLVRALKTLVKYRMVSMTIPTDRPDGKYPAYVWEAVE